VSRRRRQLKRRHNEARAIAGAIGWTLERCQECFAAPNSYHYPGCSSAPFVCPGCYAITAEPCAGYCPDAAIRSAREQEDHDLYLEEYDGDDFSA
jgi:hypothetical protein